jgi:tripartite-type tricarboxylate transporter receptor subunit TctC
MSGWSGPGRAYVRDRMSRGEMRLLVQMAPEKDPEHSDTPTIMELVNTPADRQVIALVLGRMTLGRPFIAPPGIAADRVAMLRDAFQKAVNDPDLRADAQRQKLAIDPTWGAEAQDVIERLYQTPPPVVERTRKIVAVTPEP